MNQFGTGTITVYRGSPFQRGHGVGTFLRGLFRASLPLLKRGASAVGKELLHSGVNFLEDIDHDMPVKEAFQQRMKDAQNNLKRKAIDTLFRGKGYKTKKRMMAIQSKRSVRKRKTSKKTSRKGKVRKRRVTRKIKKTRKNKGGKKKVRRNKINRNNIVDIFG